MSAPPKSRGEPVTDKRQLVEYLAAGSKTRDQWRIGTEHEKFAFNLQDLRTLPYDRPAGIRAMLEGLTRFGWVPVLENGNPIALGKDACSITLEPGGQFELSGAPLANLHETCSEVNEHLDQVKQVGAELGTGMLGMGFNPKWSRAETPWMPKGPGKTGGNSGMRGNGMGSRMGGIVAPMAPLGMPPCAPCSTPSR